METPRSAVIPVRVEHALRSTLGSHRTWGSALAVTLVLLLPGASVLRQASPVADGELSGQVRVSQQSSASAAQAVKARAAAKAKATAAAKAKAAARAKARAAAKAKAAARKAAAKAAKAKAAAMAGAPESVRLAGLNGDRSGLGWASGVYVGGSDPAKVAAFATWRGRPVDVVVDWAARRTWDDVINPDWLYDAWAGTPYTKTFGIAPLPEGDASATMAGCAAGSYNSKWHQFGKNIVDAGLGTGTVIRLGWEFNGNWYKWQAKDPGQFAECWRQIVGTVREVAPGLLWDWTVNRGTGQAVADARLAYPGDDYVDVVGVDSYDMWPAATDEAGWQQQYAGGYGLKFWSDFAAAHGKKLSVPEWGVYPGPGANGHDGGDNPFYIAKMKSFFAAEGSRLAYESYFNTDEAYYAGSLYGPTQNPIAAAKYRALFGR
jgi:Glycosyl hydrolase family 26